MSNLGFQSAYHLFNQQGDCVCERAFLPEKEAAVEHARTSTPLFSYESGARLKDFDIIAFSIPFEDDYTNIPAILGLAGLPALAKERDGSAPLIIAGGVAVSLNPEPVAGIFDAFVIGEGEGAVSRFTETYRAALCEGKAGILAAIDTLPFVYVPSFYEFEYDGPVIKGMRVLNGAKKKVTASKNLSLDAFDMPQSFIITPDAGFNGAYLAEIGRGCPRGCRFCAAGFLYLPPRWRAIGPVKEAVARGMRSCGKVGLVGTAVSEHPDIKETISFGIEKGGATTLSSLRMDKLDPALTAMLKDGGYKTITIAPEAGSERMRKIINKCLSDGEIMDAVKVIAEAGFMKMKLYFIVGLPGETDEDALGIADMAIRIKEAMGPGALSLSINPFIPKPLTPFQWCRFEDAEVIARRLKLIKKALSRSRAIVLKEMSAKEAYIQAYVARADRRATPVILNAAAYGWRPAIRGEAALIDDSVYRERGRDEMLPWDIIDYGVKKQYLWHEYNKALKGETTPACDVGACNRCGVC